MLKDYLNVIPYTKFILIEDSLENRGKQILDYLVSQHIKRNNSIFYFTFEGCFRRTENRFLNEKNITLYDYISIGRNCALPDNKHQPFAKEITSIFSGNTIVVIDSLANVILQYGVTETYRILNQFYSLQGYLQVITVLHKDLLESNAKNNTLKYFEHLSTLTLNLEPNCLNEPKRIEYIYKKAGGKVFRGVEEFRFENEELITKKIEDHKELIKIAAPKEVSPENLSTFKIGLTDQEKISREKLVLPYLPKSEEKTGGKIIYQFEATDDWDEEDPDDDLDI